MRHYKREKNTEPEITQTNLLIFCFWIIVAVMILVLGLQLYNLIAYVEPESDVPSIFGEYHKQFVLTTNNVFIFLLFPIIVVVFLFLSVQQYFQKHPHASGERIAYFERFPRRKITKYLYLLFAILITAASLILAILYYTGKGLLGNAVGFMVIAVLDVIFYFITKLLRSRKRHYMPHTHIHYDDEYQNMKPFEGKHLLLAEDNDLSAEIATEILKAAGFTVDRAEDGAVCVEKLKASDSGYYHMILMDIKMPNMDGYEATRIIRQLDDSGKASIPIYAMTSCASEEEQWESFHAGMNGHISKPISISELMKTMGAALH